jgi:hypothetical protein
MEHIPIWFFEIVRQQTATENAHQGMFMTLLKYKMSGQWDLLDSESKELIEKHFEYLKRQIDLTLMALKGQFP